MNTSSALELFFATGLLVIAFGIAARRLRNPHAISIIDLAVWFTAAFCGAGAWVSFLSIGPSSGEYRSIYVIFGYAMVYMFVGGLLLSSVFPRPRTQMVTLAERPPTSYLNEIILSAVRINPLLIVALFAIAIFIKIYYGIQYNILTTYDRPDTVANPVPSYVYGLYYSYTPMIVKVCLVWASITLFTRGSLAPLSIVIIMGSLLISSMQGRRWLLSDGFIIILCYIMLRGITIRTMILGSLVLWLIIYFGMPFIFAVRQVRQGYGSGQNSVQVYLRSVRDAIQQWNNPYLSTAYKQNTGVRMTSIQFNYMIAQAQDRTPYMMGQCFLNNIARTLPSAIIPEKNQWLRPEQAISWHYGFPDSDYASTWANHGAADFGILGSLLYGVILGYLLRGLQAVSFRLIQKLPTVGLFTFAVAYMGAVEVEGEPSALIGEIRDLLIIIIVTSVLLPFRRPTTRQESPVYY